MIALARHNEPTRQHVLERLLRLGPDGLDATSIERFVHERAAILAELAALRAPWTRQDLEVLATATAHAQHVSAQFEHLHADLLCELRSLPVTWTGSPHAVAPVCVSRRG